MSAISCSKCNLINMDNAGRCRRCGASLSPVAKGKVFDTKSLSTVRCFAIPAIAIVLAAFVYGVFIHSKGTSAPGAGLAETNKGVEKSALANPELEEVKKLCRDFMAGLDRNMADRNGEGLNKNQTLAFDTMMLLKERQNKLVDPAAQKYLSEFCPLVEKYYDQVVRYASESAHLVEVRERIKSERQRALKDPSLSLEDKIAKQSELWDENTSEVKLTTVSAGDIDQTVESLRNLSSPTAEMTAAIPR
jgi:hypothetical protein